MIGNISQPNQDNNQMGFLCFLFFFCFDGRGLGDFYDDDESRPDDEGNAELLKSN
jgi:hypothetical protein